MFLIGKGSLGGESRSMEQFHFEVLKKLHSMKSGKSLVECQDIERPNYAEINSPGLEQQNQLDNESDMEIESAVKVDSDEITAENLKSRLSKLILRNQELESALRVKDETISKLLARNAKLEKDLKRKEAMRLSQLELLALRNVELERELHEGKPQLSRQDEVIII